VLRFLRILTSFVFLLAPTVTFAQTVTIVSPSATTVSSPVRVVANFSSTAPIESISVLLDSVEVAHPEAVTPLDIDVPMSAGTHLLTINAVQSDGLQLSASRSVDVSAPAPATSTNPTSSASASGTTADPGIQISTSGGVSSIKDIEEESGWYTHPDQGNPVCSSKPNLMSSPSLDGTSGRFYLGPTGQFNNCLWPIRLGRSKTASHFTLDAYYQLSKPSLSQGIEFSSNKHIGTKWYKFSVQCSYYKGVFSVWNTAGSKWVATNIPCRRPAPNTWNHLTIQTEITNGKAVFKSLTHNGVTYAINKSFYPKTGAWAYSFGVHFQMNGNRGGDAYYAWVDNLKFTLW
jgi:hypothetical protein